MPVRFANEEPPSTRAEVLAGKVSQGLLFALFGACLVLFPLGLAFKVFAHFFP